MKGPKRLRTSADRKFRASRACGIESPKIPTPPARRPVAGQATRDPVVGSRRCGCDFEARRRRIDDCDHSGQADPMRKRADIVLVDRGFFASRARAQAAIAAGLVIVGGEPVAKPSQEIEADAEIAAEAPHPYASRGGMKLAAALDAFALDPADLFCLDVGASTGGFTDVLLRRGAGRVVAADVGRGQIIPSLAQDPRVFSL